MKAPFVMLKSRLAVGTLALLLNISIHFVHVDAAVSVPTGIVELYRSPLEEPFQVTIASTATFGESLPFGKPKKATPIELKLTPEEDVFLCNESAGLDSYTIPSNVDFDFIYVIPRGGCSFEQKVTSAQNLGAKGAIITDNLSSKYDLQQGQSNVTLSSVIWPQTIFDYNCDTELNAKIPKRLLYFDHLPYDSRNDALLSDEDGTSSSSNLCRAWSLGEVNGESKCVSGRCLLTGKGEYSSNDEGLLLQACCANDFFFEMGSDSQIDDSVALTIPSVFLNMKEGYNLLNVMQQYDTIYVIMYERPYPRVNWSSVFVFLLGVSVVWLAGWISAKEFRDTNRLLKYAPLQLQVSNPAPPIQDVEMLTNNDNNNNNNRNQESDQPISSSNDHVVEAESSLIHQPAQASSTLPLETEYSQNAGGQFDDGNRQVVQATAIHMELKMSQAFMLILLASVMLFIFYFSRLYEVLTIVYTIGATFATIQIVIQPIFVMLFRFLGCSYWMEKQVRPCVSASEVLSVSIGVFLGVYWLWIGFTTRDAGTKFFQWFYQDIMGICVSVIFLRLIRLNSIMVATVLLTASFLYDIFFVFLTPYIFGESVMEAVASGDLHTNSVHCDFDPNAHGCNTMPLPMILTVPRLNDYRDGFSVLGLGDIVLPGLLISFAARLDAAKRLVSTYNTRLRAAQRGETNLDQLFQYESSIMHRIFSGYFCPIVIAYAVGLFFANLAVYMMRRGQPALLYIVPCTLATMFFIGWKNQELLSIWIGHRKIKIAEEIKHAVIFIGPNQVGVIPLGDGGDVSFAETDSASLSDESSIQLHDLNSFRRNSV